MLDAVNIAILFGAGLVTLSIFTSLLSMRVGAPLLLVFLLVGLAAGEDGFLGIDFDNAPAAYFVGSLALAVILFDSGFGTPMKSFRMAAGPALSLATVGVLLTAGLLGVAAHLLMDLTLIEGLLLGAIVSSTDAAAVFFLLRVGGMKLRDRVRSTLEIESGSNDPMAVFLTILLADMAARGLTFSDIGPEVALTVVQQLGLGLVAGFAGGKAIVMVMRRVRLDAMLSPLTVLCLALTLFGLVSVVGGSGFLAVYVAGVTAGNDAMPQAATLKRFQAGMTWLAQIVMFLTLGLLATPSSFAAVAVPAVLLAVFLILVARPVAVWLVLLPFRFSPRDTLFASWVGLRGAVSILLAIVPMVAGLEVGQTLFNTAFIIVLVSLVVQGWSVRWMAHRLGMLVPSRSGLVERFELELPDRAGHELVVYRITENAAVTEGERVPRWARPALVVREGRSLAWRQAGGLRKGDYVYVFINPQYVPLLDRLFARPEGPDLSDTAFFGDFPLSPDTTLDSVAALYGLPTPPGLDPTRTLIETFRHVFDGRAAPGDRIALGTAEVIVRELDEHGEIASLGLGIAPAPQVAGRLPPRLARLVAPFSRPRTVPPPGGRAGRARR
ncbi:potassium/proton antiporter, partial [Caenispirillum bisanense]|uniref:potassium/proton antiporter n=1 Tax=Caenispirillum bisanense TaxID=414052 RepID=UPI0031D4A430